MRFTEEDAKALRVAVQQLEFPGLADRLTDVLGKPFEKLMLKLPDKAQQKLAKVVHATMQKALDGVVLTMDTDKSTNKASDRTHKWLSASTGFVGGFFGGWTALAEIPLTTGLMLRSIADIARSEGENLSHPEARLQCIAVLGLDSTHLWSSRKASSNEPVGLSGYYAVRNGMAAMVDEAVRFLTVSTAVQPSKSGSPVLISFMNAVGRRYGLVLSEEMALQWMPVVGGLGGASVNYLFTQHFQKLAHGHFTIRRLERCYGTAAIRAEYEVIKESLWRDRNLNSNVTVTEVAATLSKV